jgi:lia operon protein LiaF
MPRWSSGEVFFGLLLIVLGLMFLAGNLGWVTISWGVVWPLILVLFGLWLIWRAFVPASKTRGSDVSYGFGDYEPDLTGKEIRRENFSHGFGDLDLDLTRAVIPEGKSAVRVSLGFGDLNVIVPRDLAVDVHATAGFGDAELFEQSSSGIGPTLRFQSDDYAAAARKLDLHASVGFGKAKVIRSQ